MQWIFLAKSLDHLHSAQVAADALRPHLFPGDTSAGEVADGGAASAGAIAQDFASWMSAAVQSASDSVLSCMFQFGHSPVAMACVREICAILFPAAHPQNPADLAGCAAELQLAACPLSPQARLALRHLAGVSDALSRCLACWARWAINVHGVCAYLPSTLMSARSVLHLAQWVLLRAGHRTELSESVYPPGGIRGYEEEALAAGIERAADGPAASSAGLVLAQRIGAARGELLVGCLPATVMLARLLLGYARADVLRDGLHATSAQLPGSALAVHSAPAGAAQGASDWAVVRFGSPAARALAKGNLEGVLCSVVLKGRPLDLRELHSTADVADSESLWEAAVLWKQLQQERGHVRGLPGWT